MTRDSTRFRRMAWLALVAVLLMSAMPTVARVLAATASKAAPVLMEMCTTAGRQLVDVSPFIAADEPPPTQPAMAAMDACGYCVLTTPLPLVLLLLCLSGWLAARPVVVRDYLSVLRTSRNLRGLGSQAPPLAL